MTSALRSWKRGIPSLVASALLLSSPAAVAQTTPASDPAVTMVPAEPPPPPPPPPVTTSNKGKVTIKGFISATLFAQDTPFSFGDGQNAQVPIPTRDKGDDPWFYDGDIRNTRLNLTWEGPTGTALPRMGATLEVDFFAPGGGGGGFGNAQAVPRIRLAFADLGLGNMTLRIGQDWSPWFANVPVSLAHVAFPLGYGSAGAGGWRFPGLFLIVPLTAKEAALAAKLTVAVMRNVWPGAPALNPPNQGSSGLPQIEARLDLTGKAGSSGWNAYVVGHYDQKDLDGRGEAAMTDPGNLDGYGVEAGVKITVGPFMLQGNGYYGHAMGHQFAHITQFGDIAGMGVWGQVGFDLTPSLSLFAFFGLDAPDKDDVRAAIPITAETAAGALPKLGNMQAAAMLRWKVGSFQLGLEYMWDQLEFQDMMGESDVTGSQVALSAMYGF